MNKALLLNLFLCFTLTACGGGGGGGDASDNGDGKSDITDTTPDDFSFTELDNQELSVSVTSNEITLSSIDDDTAISIENGQYSINGGELLTQVSTVSAGDAITVVLTTAADFSASATATLTVGTLSVNFNVITRIKDTMPEAFSFTAIGNAEPNSYQTSNEVTLTALDNNTAISISTGSYRINEGEYTSVEGIVNLGDKVSVLLASSAAYENVASTTLTVGTVSSTFSITTRAQDSTPNVFSFSAQENVEVTTQTMSNTVTLTGFDNGTAISIANGSYSINGGDFNTQASQVNAGDTLVMQVLSSENFEGLVETVVTVGTSSVPFSVTTREKDIIPTAFEFTAITEAELNSEVASNTVTISGIDDETPFAFLGSKLILNGVTIIGGSELVEGGTVNNGDELTLYVATGDEFNTEYQAGIIIAVEHNDFVFTATTRSIDVTPSNFEFTQVEDSELSTSNTSNTITLAGIDDETDISITEGLYSLNGGEFTSEAGKVKAGDTLVIKATSADAFETLATASVTVGDFTANYQVTTRTKDTNPSYALPVLITDAALNTYVVSDTVTFSEFDGDSVTIIGAQYKLNDGEWNEAGEAQLIEGDTLALRVLSSNSYDTQVSSSVGGSGWLFAFNVTTLEDVAPTVEFNKAFEADGSTPLNATDSLVLTFSEVMDTNSLIINGDIFPCTDPEDEDTCQFDLTWSEGDTVLTLAPKEGFYWYSDVRSLQVTITGDGTLGLDESISATVLPVFETFQAADVVIGQTDFDKTNYGTSNTNLRGAQGVSISESNDNVSVLITDTYNNRILRFESAPTVNGAEFTSIFGQNDFDSKDYDVTDNRLYRPKGAIESDGKVYTTDQYNSRGLSVDLDNFSNVGSAEGVIGQDDLNSKINECDVSSLNFPEGMEILETESGTRWIVADRNSNRIMIWNNYETGIGADASIVLGQASFNDCTEKTPDSHGLNAVNKPIGVWSNGEKLIVASESSHRLLVWNTFPTYSGEEPDFQLGQSSNFTDDGNSGQNSANQGGFSYPQGMGGNTHQICLADYGNHRVLVWSNLPESNTDLADIVIGQGSFDLSARNNTNQDSDDETVPSAKTLSSPRSCDMSFEQLFVVDNSNQRVLIYNALNKRPVAE